MKLLNRVKDFIVVFAATIVLAITLLYKRCTKGKTKTCVSGKTKKPVIPFSWVIKVNKWKREGYNAKIRCTKCHKKLWVRFGSHCYNVGRCGNCI